MIGSANVENYLKSNIDKPVKHTVIIKKNDVNGLMLKTQNSLRRMNTRTNT